jgi:hypothetical protein
MTIILNQKVKIYNTNKIRQYQALDSKTSSHTIKAEAGITT